MKNNPQFIFNDLAAELEYTRQIDGLAAGTFTDMHGFEVTFANDDLPVYVTNTMRVINSTKDSSGNVVGLPIDQGNHDWEGGAGWIIGLEVDDKRNVIIFKVNWTEIGLNLISKNIRRFFSPSVDVVNKVILGGSLTNYPATRDQKGRILLSPVELSQSLKGVTMEKTIQEILAELGAAIQTALGIRKGDPKPADPNPSPAPQPAPAAALSAAPVTGSALQEVLLSNVSNPALASLGQDPNLVAELESKVTEIVQARVSADLRMQHTTRFVAELVGGTKNKPYGFSVKSKDLIAWMLSLSDGQAKFAEKLLTQMADKAIDFAERGWEAGAGFSNLKTFPAELSGAMKAWLSVKGNTVNSFFKLNPEVGKAEDFNLAEFQPVKE